MTKLEDIEKAVQGLSEADQARFRSWFNEWQERQFDDALERGAINGALDWLADEAIVEHATGMSQDLSSARKMK